MTLLTFFKGMPLVRPAGGGVEAAGRPSFFNRGQFGKTVC
jgi:hypothetical protein